MTNPPANTRFNRDPSDDAALGDGQNPVEELQEARPAAMQAGPE